MLSRTTTHAFHDSIGFLSPFQAHLWQLDFCSSQWKVSETLVCYHLELGFAWLQESKCVTYFSHCCHKSHGQSSWRGREIHLDDNIQIVQNEAVSGDWCRCQLLTKLPIFSARIDWTLTGMFISNRWDSEPF